MSKKASKDQRELKVYTKYAVSKYGKGSILPEIRLKGNWVRNWGYNYGDKITVVRINNSILLRNSNNPLTTIRL